jgi:hypothetical protein
MLVISDTKPGINESFNEKKNKLFERFDKLNKNEDEKAVNGLESNSKKGIKLIFIINSKFSSCA